MHQQTICNAVSGMRGFDVDEVADNNDCGSADIGNTAVVNIVVTIDIGIAIAITITMRAT